MQQIISFIFLLLCVFFISRTTSQSPSQCASGYGLGQYQIINFTTSAPVTDYQFVTVVDTASLIAAGLLQSTGFDMLFTNITGCNTYCFFIEVGTLDTTSTRIWVNIPGTVIDVVQVLWLYGNSGITSADASQSGDCTFNYFEDFLYGDLGSMTTCDNTTVITPQYTSEIQLDWKTSDGFGGIQTTVGFGAYASVWTIEASVTAYSGEYPTVAIYQSNGQGYGLAGNAISSKGSVLPAVTEGYYGPYDSICSVHWRFLAPKDKIPLPVSSSIWSVTWVENGTQIFDIYYPNGTSIGNRVTADASWSPTEDIFGFFGGIYTGSGSMTLDWVRVRKFTNANLTTSAGPSFTVSSANMISSSLITFVESLIDSIQYLF